MTDSTDKLKELRKPFPASAVGLLPKPYKKDSAKGDCKECGKYHGLPAVHLDYVGHAAVTDRLLEVDPTWSWEPLSLDEHGLPALDRAGNLWIKLTVLGVTRIGVGDGGNAKECIGDALRNAAMRFGVALDLWSKEELESTDADPTLKNEKKTAPKPQPAKSVEDEVLNVMTDDDKPTQAQLDRIREIRKELGYPESQTETKIKLLKTKAQAGASVGKLKVELEQYKSQEGGE